MSGPGFTGPSGGGSHLGFFHNNNPQFRTAPNFSLPFNGSNNYATLGTNYPFNQQMQTTNPVFANYGYAMPMMSMHGMHSSTVPMTPLRVTVGNLITHADICPMCMGYVADLITASDFNKIILERDGLIQGATVSHNNSQGHELVVSSLQEQLASASRSHETERQTLVDRITALELEHNELRTRHKSDVAQIDNIIHDCHEANERCLYWKDQYYNLRDHGDCQDSSTRAVAPNTKSGDKGKGREVPMVPLQNRITSAEGNIASGSSVPLSQRLSPMEGDKILQQEPEDNGVAKSTPTPVHVEEAPVKAGVSTATLTTPHMGEKQKRDVVGLSSTQHALVSYDNLRTDNSKEPTYSYKESNGNGRTRSIKKVGIKWKPKLLNELGRRAALPPPKWSKSSKNKEYNVLRGMVTKLPFQAPISVEEVERVVKALNKSDNAKPWRPMWKTVHGMVAMHKQAWQVPRAACTAMQDAVIEKFIAVPTWFATEMNRQGHPLPHLFKSKPSLKKAKGFTMRDVMPGEAGPSNVTSTSYGIENRVTAVAPMAAKGSYIRQSPTILDNRVWHGCHENDPVSKWAEAILSSPTSE
ncbi:hypothetical protein F5050DRAFT_1714839 [Lentinula boryana]|uniref:Uncharacterized protein n=1 Tax=Lentinula boryana TaxID=40481 RepID=A0ABQ8Q300_9AGAR|nr:hypothetical protein F5050DRAFT_1714839 [Lentinula boryana]